MTVKTPAQLQAQYQADLADNTTGDISPADVRQSQVDQTDSWDDIKLDNTEVTNPLFNAIKLQNKDIDATAPTEKQVLIFNIGTGKWEPSDIPLLGVVTQTPGTDTNSTKSPYSSRNAASTGQTYFSLNVPSDFSSVNRLYVRIIPDASFVAVDIDITVNSNGLGELFSANSTTDASSTYSFTLNEMSEFDITALTGSVGAGDTIGIHFDHNGIGGTIHYLNAVLEYIKT